MLIQAVMKFLSRLVEIKIWSIMHLYLRNDTPLDSQSWTNLSTSQEGCDKRVPWYDVIKTPLDSQTWTSCYEPRKVHLLLIFIQE